MAVKIHQPTIRNRSDIFSQYKYFLLNSENRFVWRKKENVKGQSFWIIYIFMVQNSKLWLRYTKVWKYINQNIYMEFEIKENLVSPLWIEKVILIRIHSIIVGLWLAGFVNTIYKFRYKLYTSFHLNMNKSTICNDIRKLSISEEDRTNGTHLFIIYIFSFR